LLSFAFLWQGLAQFGQIWLNAVMAWIFSGSGRADQAAPIEAHAHSVKRPDSNDNARIG
jgi:hypothetical protein